MYAHSGTHQESILCLQILLFVSYVLMKWCSPFKLFWSIFLPSIQCTAYATGGLLQNFHCNILSVADQGDVGRRAATRRGVYGIIPREMGDLRELTVLDLGHNNFNGSIPLELINILSLEFKCVRTLIYVFFHFCLTSKLDWPYYLNCSFLKRNRLYGDLPLELNELISLCESQVRHGRTFSNRMPAARFV